MQLVHKLNLCKPPPILQPQFQCYLSQSQRCHLTKTKGGGERQRTRRIPSCQSKLLPLPTFSFLQTLGTGTALLEYKRNFVICLLVTSCPELFYITQTAVQTKSINNFDHCYFLNKNKNRCLENRVPKKAQDRIHSFPLWSKQFKG